MAHLPRLRLALRAGVALALAVGTVGVGIGAASADGHYPSAAAIAESKARVAAKSLKVGAIEAQLASANARQARLAERAAEAVEAYNGARVQLSEAVSAGIEAQQKADDAAGQVTTSQRDLGAFAAAAYRSGGGLTTISALLSADGAADLISRAATLQSIGDYREDALQRLRGAQATAGVLQQRADALVARRQTAADAVQAAKQRAQSRLAEQQQAVSDIRGQRTMLIQALATARHTSVALVKQRQEGIAAAQAKAAAEAAARAAAEARDRAADNGGGTGGTDPGSGDTGGMGGTGGMSSSTTAGASAAIAFARAQIGKPYQWGAAGPGSFDCSGLTMRAWQQGGVSLPHYSVAQYAQSLAVSLSDLRPGDLVFFGSNAGDYHSIYHVGLYIGDGQMIEAPYTGENVRIASIWRSSLVGAARP